METFEQMMTRHTKAISVTVSKALANLIKLNLSPVKSGYIADNIWGCDFTHSQYGDALNVIQNSQLDNVVEVKGYESSNRIVLTF